MIPYLSIRVAGSSFSAPFDDTRFDRHRALLDCADGIALHRNGHCIDVELDDMKRWVAFYEEQSGSALYCVGYQETVGAVQKDGMYIGGSNRQVLCWLAPDGTIRVTSS